MFYVTNNTFIENISLHGPINTDILFNAPMEYFDKDGFELNQLEQAFYKINHVELNNHLHHTACQRDWIIQDPTTAGVHLDHSMLIMRYDYQGQAKHQLKYFAPFRPALNKLLFVRKKWGVDISIDWVDDNNVFELLHLEVDSNSFEEIQRVKEQIENVVLSTNFEDAHKQILKRDKEWVHLPSDDQSDWKARFFGFSRAFETIKVI